MDFYYLFCLHFSRVVSNFANLNFYASSKEKINSQNRQIFDFAKNNALKLYEINAIINIEANLTDWFDSNSVDFRFAHFVFEHFEI
jgi:hypothetical protein